jgi:hypothetical protein
MPLRILIADDSNVVRAAIRDLLNCPPEAWVICGEAADAEETLSKLEGLSPMFSRGFAGGGLRIDGFGLAMGRPTNLLDSTGLFLAGKRRQRNRFAAAG